MNVTWITVQPLVALVAGLLILFIPRLLNYIVAIYLIVIGLTGIIGNSRAETLAPASAFEQVIPRF